MGEKKPRGRPRHEPTETQRHQARIMIAMGLDRDSIAKVIGIDESTLLLRYREELDSGSNYLNTRVAAKLFEKCMKGDTACIIFWCKTRLGWREKLAENPTSDDRIININFTENGIPTKKKEDE